MKSIRRWIIAGTAVVVACGPGLAPSMRRGLSDGRDAAKTWIVVAASAAVPDSIAISVAYLERLRLGLGSPFRLVDQAVNDARLSGENRRRLAWALLARTLDGEAYRVDPRAVAGMATPAAAGSASLHLELIDETIRQTPDPRTGELAVRLAYTKAAAEGAMVAAAPLVAARAAALLRDRELARADVLRLLEAAGTTGEDPLSLLAAWRADRRFEVEAPLSSFAIRSETLAQEAARLGERIRSLALHASSHGTIEPGTTSLLSYPAALRLAAGIDSAEPPPHAAVAVSVAASRAELLDDENLDERTRLARERFLERALSEEAFAAEHAILEYQTGENAAAGSALTAAIALRAFAQEPAWFPGFPAPTAEELRARYGLAGVHFADGVPESWQSYYLRGISLALADVRRVLPAVDLTGLHIRIAGIRAGDGILALHDPRRRQLTLPPASGAGTLAHEIAHDLDWQVALRRYGVRGDYASDGAVHAPRDPLAIRLSDLAQASVDAFDDATSHAQRPTENLARNVDWFVAVSLAAEGRSNGYLTSIQDEVLTGYGSARPPDTSGIAGQALVEVLDEVAPLDQVTRARFLSLYGRDRQLSGYDEARRMLEVDSVPIDVQLSTRPAGK
ncbi:MAG: hypothetical protein L0271_14475 [Gemmatimonadetes bacterium]|nr:hypothetical protein [Gemmatimonadota bacterium]